MLAFARRLTPNGAMLCQFFGFGIVGGLWTGSVPAVANVSRMATVDLGFAFTLFTGAYILAMALGGWLLTRASPRAVVLAAMPVTLVAIISFVLSADPIMMTVALTLIGGSMGLGDLAMNTEGTLVERDMGRPLLARLHGMASLGTAIGAIAGSVFALTVGTWASACLAIVAISGACLVVNVATPQRPPIVRRHRSTPRAPISFALLALGVVFGITAAAEMSAMTWSGRLLEQQAPALAAIAGLGVSFFALCQAMLRFFGDRLRHLFGDRLLVPASLMAATVGFAIVGQSTGFEASVVGFAGVGLGTALLVPCIFAIAARSGGASGGSALSVISMIAGLPRLVAPAAFGAAADHWSTGVAFGLVAAALIVALVLSLTASRVERLKAV